ncbi:MAG: permease [Robiginitalea sp.]
MTVFFDKWAEAVHYSLGFFWMAFWAFALGYLISSIIQVFITERRMQKAMGGDSLRDISLGTFFGFISSSCSFSALATTKSLFQKGAGFSAALSFLLASTNLVIELGIIIAIFLGWQFVVGEYVGGILLVLITWVLVRIIRPASLIRRAREHLGSAKGTEMDGPENRQLKTRLSRGENWAKVARQYKMEWGMVWKDVTLGFTVAGIVAAFVPESFFQSLFINSGSSSDAFTFLEVLQHVLVGPMAAFLTFIGSMGNIPLAALLYGKGVSFGGVMAFIFSDLVVFPVLRINARYYGWRMSLFILMLLFIALVVSALLLHFGFSWIGILPDPSQVDLMERAFFSLDYTFFLNLTFLIGSAFLLYHGFARYRDVEYHKEMAPKSEIMERTLKWIAYLCFGWMAVGAVLLVLG